MKKFSKKTLFSVLAMLMALCLMLSACGGTTDSQQSDDVPGTSADPTDSQSNPTGSEQTSVVGYYTGNVGGMTSFFHFNEDGTYYCAFYEGGMTDAGTYTVVEGTLEYYTEYDGDTKTFVENSKQTADCYIELTSYGEGVTDSKIPLVDDQLASVNTSMTHCFILTKDESYADPNGIETNFRYVVLQLFAENNSVKTLTLYHDMSYEDLTGDLMADGTYTIDGEDTYTLSESLGGPVSALVVDENGAATLTTDGTEKQLRDALLSDSVFEGEFVLATVEGETTDIIQGQTATVVLNCNAAEGTYTLDAHLEMYSGAVVLDFVLDEGTYVEGTDATYMNMIPTFEFTSNNEGTNITVERVFDTATMVATYTVAVTLSEVPVTIPFSGSDFVPVITGDGTATLTYTVQF